jgi:hypothetical protein
VVPNQGWGLEWLGARDGWVFWALGIESDSCGLGPTDWGWINALDLTHHVHHSIFLGVDDKGPGWQKVIAADGTQLVAVVHNGTTDDQLFRLDLTSGQTSIDNPLPGYRIDRIELTRRYEILGAVPLSMEDKHDEIWIRDRKGGTFTRIATTDNGPYHTKGAGTLCADEYGIVWVRTEAGALNIFSVPFADGTDC